MGSGGHNPAECRRPTCHEPACDRQVTLILGNGTIDRACGPFCTHHTDQLLAALPTVYDSGEAAYKVTEVADA